MPMNAYQFARKYGLNTFKISESFVNTRKYLVVYIDEIDFADEIKPHHGKLFFDRKDVRQVIKDFELIESLGGLELAKQKLHLAETECLMLIAVPIQSGIGHIYAFKVGQAIQRIEQGISA